jgi:hypothetical protein
MKKSIEAMKTKLESMMAQAEDRCDSENEDTANKYSDVLANLETAFEALNDALDCFQA